MQSSTQSFANDELQVEIRNHVAHLTLNRPTALNALSHGMIRGLTQLFTQWAADPNIRCVVMKGAGEKAFCAGGDIRALRDSALGNGSLHRDFFIEEYALDYQLHRYVKPVISVLDGIVMGGGMGISQGSGFRLVGPKTKMAMPETGIGLFPDVGGSYFLSRSPVGLYLGLTGLVIKAGDALHANLADRYLSAEGWTDLFARLDRLLWTGDSGQDVARLIEAVASQPAEPSTLAPLTEVIDRHFRYELTVPEIVASLRAETRAEWKEWTKTTADLLDKRSPTMLCVTHEQLKRGRHLKLADCFRMELSIVNQCFVHGDVLEGIRAVIIDKDGKPAWKPATLDDVKPESVNAFFAAARSSEALANLETRFG
jgi:enoyl-CoA hydratase/carnithine racemase